jgi:hypothetical protein
MDAITPVGGAPPHSSMYSNYLLHFSGWTSHHMLYVHLVVSDFGPVFGFILVSFGSHSNG